MHSTLGIVIMTQDTAQSDREIQRAILPPFCETQPQPSVFVLRYTKKDRIEKLNACLEHNLDAVDRFAVFDADILPQKAMNAALQYVAVNSADIYCLCDLIPKMAVAQNMHRHRFVRYLCAEVTFWYFSEKAMHRMRTADTFDLVQEALTDSGICIDLIPKEIGGFNGAISKPREWIRLFRYIFDVHLALTVCGSVALFAMIVFLLLLFRGRSIVNIIGFFASIHIFLFSLGALLIQWYRRSYKLEKRARSHQYVEESRLQ